MKRFSTWALSKSFGWPAIVMVAAGMFFLSEYAGLPTRWGNALLYTVVLFTLLIIVCRSDWSMPAFWRTVGVIFVIHSFLVILLMQIMPNSDKGIVGLPRTLAGLAEGCVILWALGKRGALSG